MLPTDLKTQLRRDESVRNRPYDDADGATLVRGDTVKGNITIAVGRNLSGKGMSDIEIDFFLDNDIQDVMKDLALSLPWTTLLDPARLGVLLNMAFNMGVPGLLNFHRTLAYVQAGNFDAAADEMLQSTWAVQVGARAHRLSAQMRTGLWQ